MDVFALSHEDMPRIDLSVITHRLNMSPSYKLIRQKRRVFAPEQDNANQRRSPEVDNSKVRPQILLL